MSTLEKMPSLLRYLSLVFGSLWGFVSTAEGSCLDLVHKPPGNLWAELRNGGWSAVVRTSSSEHLPGARFPAPGVWLGLLGDSKYCVYSARSCSQTELVIDPA